MRDRHVPRLCSHCQAPMARQEGSCWRCGTAWATEDQPRTTLRVIPGGADSSLASEVALPLPATAAMR